MGLYDTQVMSCNDGFLGSYNVQGYVTGATFRRKLLPPLSGLPNLVEVDGKAGVSNSVHCFFKRLKEY